MAHSGDTIALGVISLGCNKNRVDTEQMLAEVCRDTRYVITNDLSNAQVVVINTCAFIQSATQESIGAILEVTRQKGSGPLMKVVVTGCLPERYQTELVQEMPEVDAFVGVHQYGMMGQVLERVMAGERVVEFEVVSEATDERILTTAPHLAYVRIAEGCDHHCSYCTIPSIRGRYKSRPMEDIVAECTALVAGGVKELCLVAQDTSCYGRDLYGQNRLPQLLEQLSATGAPWIRLLYTYPERIDAALLDVMEAHENLINYLDMPLQHADDDILRAMGRPMNRQSLQALITLIEGRSQRFSLRTTLITGFPGETQAQHAQNMALLDQQVFGHVGVFPYSQEEGTRAAAMDGQLPDATKQARANQLMRRQRSIATAMNQRYIGEVVPVLIERAGQRPGECLGRAPWQAPEVDGLVIVSACSAHPGEFVRCKIERADAYDFWGRCL